MIRCCGTFCHHGTTGEVPRTGQAVKVESSVHAINCFQCRRQHWGTRTYLDVKKSVLMYSQTRSRSNIQAPADMHTKRHKCDKTHFLSQIWALFAFYDYAWMILMIVGTQNGVNISQEFPTTSLDIIYKLPEVFPRISRIHPHVAFRSEQKSSDPGYWLDWFHIILTFKHLNECFYRWMLVCVAT